MIRLDRIWKTYPKQLGTAAHVALKDVSFTLSDGEVLGLVGANGAGKSTCIRLLMDFIRPDKGEISLFGMSPENPSIRRQIGYLPEIPSFPSNLSVLDMLRFTGATCHMPKPALAKATEKWLNHLELWEARHRPLRVYSKGMKQRAGFALALINDPELLILDEPMSGLDPIGRAKITSLIQELRKEGKSILFCSHILEDVDRLADTVLVLHKGEKLFHGSPSELCLQERGESFVDAFSILVQVKEDHV